MYGGSIGRLYGAKGSSKSESNLAQVDGTVGLFIKGGQISYETAVAYYANVKKAELYATDGKMYRYVYGLNTATADELVFRFTDQAQMVQTSLQEEYKMYIASQSTVNKMQRSRLAHREAGMHLQIIMVTRSVANHLHMDFPRVL